MAKPDAPISKAEMHEAAISILRKSGQSLKSRSFSHENSRVSANSYIVIGNEGEIIGRVGLSEVYKYCSMAKSKNQAATLSADSLSKVGGIVSNLSLEKVPPLFIQCASIVIALGITGGALSYCARQEENRKAKQASLQLEQLTSEWNIDKQIALNTSRIALAVPVMKLRDHAKTVDQTNLPSCFNEAKASLRKHMDSVIEAFTRFMGDSEATISTQFIEAELYLSKYKKSLSTCSQ
jgi:hypothetical protein